MDSAVALVQTYLRINGYFTVSEYPIVELRRGFHVLAGFEVAHPGVQVCVDGRCQGQHQGRKARA